MSDTKLEFSFDATALGNSACDLKFKRIVVGEFDDNNIPAPEGGYKSTLTSAIVYGIGLHKFADVMFKTGGEIVKARDAGLSLFRMPKTNPSKNKYLDDEKHFMSVCYNLWTEYVEKDEQFEVLQLPQLCSSCEGTGEDEKLSAPDARSLCDNCKGTGKVDGPATELTFKLLIYEDDICRIYLTGTLDTLGKVVNGCYAIRDWKTTSSWQDGYFEQYELSRQLRVYTIAAKMMAKLHPDSIIGKVGATKMGAFIDGIFLTAKSNDVKFVRSDVMQFGDDDLASFMDMLLAFCKRFSDNIKNKTWAKTGILNGECMGRYGYKCMFWNICKNDDRVGALLLKRDFQRKVYNPLAFNT